MKTFTVKIYEEQIAELKKENFFLKLRIFNLEEWLRNKNYDPSILSNVHGQDGNTVEGRVDCNCENVQKRDKAIQGLVQLIQKKDSEMEEIRQAAELVAAQHAELTTKLEQNFKEYLAFVTKTTKFAKQLQQSLPESNSLVDRMALVSHAKQLQLLGMQLAARKSSPASNGQASESSTTVKNGADVENCSDSMLDGVAPRSDEVRKAFGGESGYPSSRQSENSTLASTEQARMANSLLMSADRSTHVFREILDATFTSVDQSRNDDANVTVSNDTKSDHSGDSGVEHGNDESPVQFDQLSANTDRHQSQSTPLPARSALSKHENSLNSSIFVAKRSVSVQTSDDRSPSSLASATPTVRNNSDSSGRRNNKSVSKTVTFADSCLELDSDKLQTPVSMVTSTHLPMKRNASVLKPDLAEMQCLSMDLLMREKASTETNTSQTRECVRALCDAIDAARKFREQLIIDRLAYTSKLQDSLKEKKDSQPFVSDKSNASENLLPILQESNRLLTEAMTDLQYCTANYSNRAQ